MFRSEDYLRSEIEKVEQGVPLSTDIDAFSNEINSFLKKISGAAPAQPEASQAAPAASGAAASAPAAPASLPDDKDAACFSGRRRGNGESAGLYDRKCSKGM